MTADEPDGVSALQAAWRLPLAAKLGYLRLILLAVVLELAVRVVPIGALAKWLRVKTKWTPDQPKGRRAEMTPAEILRVRRTVQLMRRWPFADGACLRQALMVSVILRRHHPVLCLGVKSSASPTLAHAWVEMDGGTIGNPGDYVPFTQRGRNAD